MSKKESVSTGQSSEKSNDNDRPSTATEFAWRDALADKQSKARHYLLSEFMTWIAVGVAIYALVFIISAAWHDGARS